MYRYVAWLRWIWRLLKTKFIFLSSKSDAAPMPHHKKSVPHLVAFGVLGLKSGQKSPSKLRLFTVSLAPGTQLSGMTVCRRQFAAFVIFAGTSGKVYTLYRKIAKIMLYITIYFEIPAKCIHFAGILKSVTYNINAFFNSTKIQTKQDYPFWVLLFNN